jgi:peptide/nickel transport system substrate-binding protein
MHRRLWLSVVTLLVGAGMLVAAGVASPASSSPSAKSSAARKGGTLRLNLSETDYDYVDPALAYFQPSWLTLYSVCANLLNYPDRAGAAGSRLAPDLARSFPKVTAGGRVYTFTLKSGMRFSNGKVVRPADVVATFDRLATPAINSPAIPFFSDIAGAPAVTAGRTKHISGVRALRGNRVQIRLTKPGPDILSRMAMPFFCILPKGTPATEAGLNTFHTAGPYQLKSRTPNRSAVLVRNKFYRGNRPRNASQIIINVQTNQETTLSQVRAGQRDYDIGGSPPSAHAGLARQYGVNKGRYFVNPEITTRYWALNTTRGAFGNTNRRKAVNFAIDRRAIIRQRGAFAGNPTDQLLPPRLRGYKNAGIYPTTRPNVTQARRLMGSYRGTVKMYTGTSPAAQNTAAVFQANLQRLGVKVDIDSFSTGVMYRRAGTRGEPFDVLNAGWIADYADPFDFIDILLNGNNIHESNNNNYSYWKNTAYIRKMTSAARLFGTKRYQRYGALDIDIAKNAAPMANWMNDNARDFIGPRTGCFLYQPIYSGPNLGVLCKK